jgi:hypothetical protein
MKRRRSNSRRRGGVAVFSAVALPALLCATALVLDGGMLMSRQRQTQAVADAAAHAAACMLYQNYAADAGLDPSGTAKAAALSIATSNDYDDKTNSKVVVNIPATSGTFAGTSGSAEVVVTYYQPRYFSAVMGSGTIPVTARSVGRVITNTPPSILITDPSAAGALTLTGGARLTANAAIQVNSANPGAVNASNGAYATDNGGLNIVGGYSIPSWATTSTFFSKAPTTGNSIAADPYATLPAPSTAGLSTRSAPNPPYGSATIYPGIYNGGLTLGGGMTITMSPGIYYMKGNFTVANGVTLTGTSGVMIYMDSGAISLQGGCTVKLTAPSSGTYSGIVYYQNRSNTSSLNNIANGATVTMSGALYAPNAPLTIAGGAYGSTYGSQFVVKSLNLSNGVNITVNTSLTSGSTSAPFLAE